MSDERMSFTKLITMYKIINKQKNNKTLYTVVFTTNVDGWNQLQLPLCQSYDYDKCVTYINDNKS